MRRNHEGVIKRVDKSFVDLMNEVKQDHKNKFGFDLTDKQASASISTLFRNNINKKGENNKLDMGGIFR